MDIFKGKTISNLEVEYVLSLCECPTEEIIKNILTYMTDNNDNIQHALDLIPNLSDTSIEWVRRNLKTNPTIILFLSLNCLPHTTDKALLIQEIVINEVNLLLDTFLMAANNNEAYKIDSILPLINYLSMTRLGKSDIKNTIISKIHQLNLYGHRADIYLSLIAQTENCLLKEVVEYELNYSATSLDTLHPKKMIELCFGFRKHWLLETIANWTESLNQDSDMAYDCSSFSKVLWQIILINIANSFSINTDVTVALAQLKKLFSSIEYQTSEEQLFLYINEIYREMNLIKFCTNNSNINLSLALCEQLRCQSALSLICQVCDISKLDMFKVKQALTLNNELLHKHNHSNTELSEINHWDIMTYNAFYIVTSIIDVILKITSVSTDVKSVTHKIDEIKIMISNLHPIKYRIEILQNIFACLFLRYEYFSNEETSNKCPLHISSHSDSSYFTRKDKVPKQYSGSRGFICQPLLAKELLLVIKDSISDVQDKYLNRNTKNAQKMNPELLREIKENIQEFETIVSNAMWRWQLITSLKSNLSSKHTSISSLYQNIVDKSSDEDETNWKKTSVKRKIKTKKRHYNSDDEKQFQSTKESESDATCGSSLVQFSGSDKPDFMSLMLSPPNSLLALCLEALNFSKANSVLEMYDMYDTEGSTEVTFTKYFLTTAAQIKNIVSFSEIHSTSNVGEVEKVTGTSIVSAAVVSLLQSFLSTCRTPYNCHFSELVHGFPQLQPYDHCTSQLISIIDMAVCAGLDRNITYGIINIAEMKCQEITSVGDKLAENNFIIFIQNMINIIYDIYQNNRSNFTNSGICDILRSDKVPINYKEYIQQVDNMEKMKINSQECTNINKTLSEDENMFMNIVNNSDFFLIDFGVSTKEKKSYIKSFHTYLKSISALNSFNSQIAEVDNKSVNFDVLQFKIHEIIGQLIIDKNVSIDRIEPVCKNLGINFIHKLVLNFCPPIICNYSAMVQDSRLLIELIDIVCKDAQNENTPIQDDLTNECKEPNKEILSHILIHNWIIANLIKKINSCSSEYVFQQSLDARTKYLDIYLQEDKFEILKVLYYNNKPITALQTFYNEEILFNYIRKLLLRNELHTALLMLNALPEYQVNSNELLLSLRDHILLKLSTNQNDKNNWKFFFSISNPKLQAENALKNLPFWSYKGAKEILQYICFHVDFDTFIKKQCEEWIIRLTIYEEISQYSPESSWFNIFSLSNDNPDIVHQILADSQQFELYLKWTTFHQVSSHMQNLIMMNLLQRQLVSSSYDSSLLIDELNTLLSMMSTQDSVVLCNNLIHEIRDLNLLQVVVNFLKNNTFERDQYENIRIGILIMSEIGHLDRELFWDIIHKPLLILEQYLMNSKLEILAKLINKIKPTLKTHSAGENDLFYNISHIHTAVITINTVDALLRIYAKKSLDLRSIRNPKLTKFPRSSRKQLLQSIDSINLLGDFTMPEDVPSQDLWVPDSESDRCMVCKTTFFSIIIRKHHCRRCGRLICYLCSQHRMQIPGLYNDIKVRVCDDCHNQTLAKVDSKQYHSVTPLESASTTSYHSSMEWCLNADPKHNAYVRKEFHYEFSPNVALCLKIMKMHSINLIYPRFLLDRSTELFNAVKDEESSEARELLYMNRALLVWCVVLYARPPPEVTPDVADPALVHTEQRLATSDVLSLLVSHGAHKRITNLRTNIIYANIPEDALDTNCIRVLLAAEKWDLALEITTKLGMSRDGVQAAWGKACLRAGCFKLARQKFSLCFKNDLPLVSSPSKTGLDTGSQQDLSKMRNNPALLNEIISMLENISYPIGQQIFKKAETLEKSYECLLPQFKTKKTTAPVIALNVMHALSSLKNIKLGDYSDFRTSGQYVKKTKQPKKQSPPSETFHFDVKQKLEPFFYNECLFYLTTYGSHASMLEFYLKYNKVEETLQYCLDNQVDKDVFTDNVFMVYLKNEQIDVLLKGMCELDSTWSIWTDFLLNACRVLQRNCWAEALYTVQAGVGDHVRAAITCAGLYTRPTEKPHAAALLARAHYLAQAKGHLQHVPRLTNLEFRESSNRSLHLKMDGPSLDKHINTICRQQEVVNLLHDSEISGRLTETMVNEIMPTIPTPENECFLPTLFGTSFQKIKLAVLIILCASDINKGVTLCTKIINEYTLEPKKVYSHVAKLLVNSERCLEIIELCDTIKKSTITDASGIIGNIVEISVSAIVRTCDNKGRLFDELAEMFINKTDDIKIKISCYIECRLLKAAYSLAVKANLMEELKQIMKEAERLGQTQVKNACKKRLLAQNSTKK